MIKSLDKQKIQAHNKEQKIEKYKRGLNDKIT